MTGTTMTRVNATAYANMIAFSGRTGWPMPAVRPVQAVRRFARKPARARYRAPVELAQPKPAGRYFIVDGRRVDLALVRAVWTDHRAGLDPWDIAKGRHVAKTTVDRIIQLGRWNRLGKW